MAEHSPIVIGNIASNLTPTPGATLDVVEWGLDRMVRPYCCLTADFERLCPAKGSADPQYKSMVLSRLTEKREEGLLSYSDLHYIGPKSGTLPDPLFSFITTTRSASIERTVNSTGGGSRVRQYDVLYTSPSVNVRYISDGKPRTFTGVSLGLPVILVSKWVITTNTTSTGESEGVRGSGFPPSMNYTPTNEGGSKIPIEGTKLFACEESWFVQIS